MKKIVIVINGKGGVGKDTLCFFASEKYKVMNISSIDPIKTIAQSIGWDGRKDNKSRKLLSDLKKIATDYNDYPTRYLLEMYNEFLANDFEVLFVHIREKEQIQHFMQEIKGNAVSLLIRRKSKNEVYGNDSDDNVEGYDYDYIYNNDKPLSNAKQDFLSFFDSLLKAEVSKHESCI